MATSKTATVAACTGAPIMTILEMSSEAALAISWVSAAAVWTTVTTSSRLRRVLAAWTAATLILSSRRPPSSDLLWPDILENKSAAAHYPATRTRRSGMDWTEIRTRL